MEEAEDEDVEWVVSEVHMVPEYPASSDIGAGEHATPLYLSRFPLYADGSDEDEGDEGEDKEVGPRGEGADVDEEGDLLIPRRRSAERRKRVTGVVTLMHALRSTLPAVGLQLWRGSLVLAEYIMREQDEGRWRGVHALELGAGAGLAGLIMARHASRVWLTDYDEAVLANCERNGRLNRHLFEHEDVVHVRKLDWMSPPSFTSKEVGNNESDPYGWSRADLEEYQHVSVLLAADVVYEEHLTTALFGLLEEMLEGGRVLVLSIEKRINFTLEDLAPTSKSYDHFRSFFVDVDAEPAPTSSSLKPRPRLQGRRVPVAAVPQRFDYERVNELELWRLCLGSQALE